MRKIILAVSMAASFTIPAVAVIAPTAQAASRAPNVRCHRLDRAERTLHRKGFRTVERGGGLFGIVFKKDWVVVHEHQSGRTVILTAGRYC